MHGFVHVNHAAAREFWGLLVSHVPQLRPHPAQQIDPTHGPRATAVQHLEDGTRTRTSGFAGRVRKLKLAHIEDVGTGLGIRRTTDL